MDSVGGDGGNEGVQLVLLLLQFLDQALDGTLGEAFVFAALPVAHETVHDTEAGVITVGRVHGHPAALTDGKTEQQHQYTILLHTTCSMLTHSQYCSNSSWKLAVQCLIIYPL